MTKRTFLSLAIAGLLSVAMGVAVAADAVNTKCPMAPSKAVNPAVTTEWNGKTVAFCCKGCKGKFEKLSDEEKAKKLEAAK